MPTFEYPPVPPAGSQDLRGDSASNKLVRSALGTPVLLCGWNRLYSRRLWGSKLLGAVLDVDNIFELTVLSDQIFYDVSLVDGYTCGITVKPDDNACEPITCVAPPHLGIDDHQNCTVYPQSNLITDVRTGSAPIGCKSDCAVYEADEYCCRV
ncbi:Thaumatin-like protein [Colletotrichum fructicola]|nr:Thaumatin-like protein [Colletotrichum fructicola]